MCRGHYKTGPRFLVN